MDFRQIEVFVHVVREGNFSKAADKLYLTQPTVSAHIEALEKEIDMPLFERRNRQAVLTDAGENLYPYAVDILGLKERAKNSFDRFKKSINGTLQIKASQTPGIYLLPKLVAPFMAEYPEVNVNISISNTRQVFTSISSYEADIGFVGELFEDPKIVTKKLFSDELVLIASRGWKDKLLEIMQEKGAVHLEDIWSMPFIIRSSGSATQKAFEKALKANGYQVSKLRIVGMVDSLEGIINLVREGVGVSLVSKYSVEGVDHPASFQVVDLQPLRSFHVIYHKDRVLSPTCDRFLETIHNGKGE